VIKEVRHVRTTGNSLTGQSPTLFEVIGDTEGKGGWVTIGRPLTTEEAAIPEIAARLGPGEAAVWTDRDVIKG
jgi:hypothetical protein